MARGLDASRVQFRVAHATKVSELLRALSWIRGTPVLGNLNVNNPEMFVNVQVPATALPTANWYDLRTSSIVSDTSVQIAPAIQFRVARVGGRFQVPKIDMVATAPGTIQDFADWSAAVAAIATIRSLDTSIARGTVGAVPSTNGLAGLLSPAGAFSFSGDLDADLRKAMSK